MAHGLDPFEALKQADPVDADLLRNPESEAKAAKLLEQILRRRSRRETAHWRRTRNPRVPRRLGQRATRISVVALTVVGVLVLAVARGQGPAAIDSARAAVGKSPDETIVHFISTTHDPDGRLTGRTELWGATSPPFARRSIIQGPDGPPIEQGASGDAVTQFNPDGIVYVRTIKGGTAEGVQPADFAPRAEQLRTYLKDGATRDQGVVSIDGRTLHRFTIFPQEGGRCTYDVQPDTFFGVELSCFGLAEGDISERWEYLQRQGNEQLLSVLANHPSARIDRAPMASCGSARHTLSTPPCLVVSPGA